MRRPFLRIPGSPQATPVVETPAYYAPTLFLKSALLFRGGDWECQSLSKDVPLAKHGAKLVKNVQCRYIKDVKMIKVGRFL